jgi:surface antigen
MQIKALYLACAVTVALGMAACTNEQSGQVIGGILGGAAGSQVGGGTGKTVATVAGTLAGVMIGGAVGRSMDDTDRLKAAHSLEYNRTNQPSSWHNPDTGIDYTVTPTRTYQTGGGQYCREYQTDVIVGGKREQAYGTACRQPDGSWQVVS